MTFKESLEESLSDLKDLPPTLINLKARERRIAKKILHWSRKRMSSDDNTQWLSRECHVEKDRTTPERYMADLRQRKGKRITLEQVINWSSESEYNKRT